MVSLGMCLDPKIFGAKATSPSGERAQKWCMLWQSGTRTAVGFHSLRVAERTLGGFSTRPGIPTSQGIHSRT